MQRTLQYTLQHTLPQHTLPQHTLLQHTLQHTLLPIHQHPLAARPCQRCNTHCNLRVSPSTHTATHTATHTGTAWSIARPCQQCNMHCNTHCCNTLLPTDHQALMARPCQPRNAHCNTHCCNTLQHTLVPPHHRLNHVSQCNIHSNTHYCNTHCNTHCNTLVPTDPQALMARQCQPYLCYPSAEIAQKPWYCSASASVAHQNRWDIVLSPTFFLFFGCAFVFSNERRNDTVNKSAHTCARTQTHKNKKNQHTKSCCRAII